MMSLWLYLMLRRAALCELELLDRQIAALSELIRLRAEVRDGEAELWSLAEQCYMLGDDEPIREVERRWYGR